MSEASREQILSDFQECTELENVEECIHILDEHQWNLMNAIQAVHERIGGGIDPEPTEPIDATTNQNSSKNKRQSDWNDLDQPRIIRTVPGNQQVTTGTSSIVNSGPVRDLHFTIEYCDQTENVMIYDNESVYQLRLKISQKLPIPPNKQHFLNWIMRSYDDQTILKTLHLPRENTIRLSSIENESTTQTSNHTTSSGEIPLTQSDTSSNQQISTIRRNVKHSIITTTDRNEDEQMDIEPDHGSESFQEDEVAFLSQTTSPTTTPMGLTSGRQPLIPDDCTDDVAALEHFSQVFQARYGSTGPLLYIGPLDQAIQDSLHSSIHNRRPLAIYLHNDQSVCANVFCSQNLSADSIIEYLANNYVFWAWDVTSDVNKTKLFETLRRCVGNQCTQRVGSMDNDIFPLLLIVIRSRGSLELTNIIEGKSTPSEVLSNLIQSYESFEQQRLRDVDEEVMRERRENLKKQQEDEYEQSRQTDLAKERARQEEENTNERLKQQRLQQQQESKARLTDEPNETEKNITRLKIRLPDDEGVLIRRFRISDTLQVLFDYLTTEGRMVGEYKLLTTYPKRDLTTIDRLKTFEQLKLYPQEQLILESL